MAYSENGPHKKNAILYRLYRQYRGARGTLDAAAPALYKENQPGAIR